MDVSGWTIEQRMRLPDWCFGNRQIISAYLFNGAPGVRNWAESVANLPDPACIWRVDLFFMPDIAGTGQLRIGLADAAPAVVADMDAAQEIFPDFGTPMAGPNYHTFETPRWNKMEIEARIGMVTGGKKLVIENHCITAKSRFTVSLLVSALPTDMAGWLEHSLV